MNNGFFFCTAGLDGSTDEILPSLYLSYPGIYPRPSTELCFTKGIGKVYRALRVCVGMVWVGNS